MLRNDGRRTRVRNDELNVPCSEIPAVTHVCYSARVQTARKETNPRYYVLIKRFKDPSGCPVIINAASNVHGGPIICTPEDTFRCFIGTELDVLVLGNALLSRIDKSKALASDYKIKHELD